MMQRGSWIGLSGLGLLAALTHPAWSVEPNSNPSKAPVSLQAAAGPALESGKSGIYVFTAKNDGAAALRVDAAGLKFVNAQGAEVPGFTVQPVQLPALIPANSSSRFEFNVTAPPGLSTAGLTPVGNLFLYNTSVGTGANMLENPSLESGDFDPEALPEAWAVVHDAPSQADWQWQQIQSVSGSKGFTMTKTAAGGGSYLQQVLLGGTLLPNTSYTFSGWVKTVNITGEGWAGLFLYWFDNAYHGVSPMPRLTGTSDGWVYVSGTFTTAELPVQQTLPRGVLIGPDVGTAHYDNFALSRGEVDGAITLTGPTTPDPVIPGDLDGDGKATVRDATLALRMAVGLTQPTAQDLRAADFNGNGRVDVPDVTRLLRMAVGLIS